MEREKQMTTAIANLETRIFGKDDWRSYYGPTEKLHSEIEEVLKCDIRKFFDSIDHDILVNILDRKIKDDEVMKLMR